MLVAWPVRHKATRVSRRDNDERTFQTKIPWRWTDLTIGAALMGRPRIGKAGNGLLDRMQARVWSDGKTVTYRYLPVNGAPKNLGTDKIVAIRTVLDLLGLCDSHGTLEWVWESFSNAKDPSKRWSMLSDSSKSDYKQAWKQIAKTFGSMLISHIDSSMISRYVHVERADSPKRANTEKALLSNLFGWGIFKDVCKVNATIGVDPRRLEARSYSPDRQLLENFLTWLDMQTPQRRIVGMAAEYASLAGNRKVEFLNLTWSQVDRAAGEIRTLRAKQRGTKKLSITEAVAIGPEMQLLLERLEVLRTERECHYVFPTRDNNQYSSRGFQTLWQRCLIDAVTAGILTAETRFTFHDLRAYYATKHKKVRGVLPDLHANKETTARIYDRNKVVERESF